MPYNDTYMTYSPEKHRYVLTLDYANDVRNIDLLDISDGEVNNNNAAVQVLEKVSRQIYNHIYLHAMHRYRTERALAIDAGNRQVLMDAMGDQLEWLVENGDPSNIADQALQTVGYAAHDTLLAAGLLFTGNNSGERQDIVPRYQEEGY